MAPDRLWGGLVHLNVENSIGLKNKKKLFLIARFEIKNKMNYESFLNYNILSNGIYYYRKNGRENEEMFGVHYHCRAGYSTLYHS